MVYQKILVPIDGSEHSRRALKEAISLAKMTEGNITLLSVCTKGANQDNEALENKCKNALDDMQKIVKAEGVPVHKLLLEGKVVDQIVRTAKEGCFDLVVIGARGLSRLEEIMMGSVSHGVAENAPCPVIVTR